MENMAGPVPQEDDNNLVAIKISAAVGLWFIPFACGGIFVIFRKFFDDPNQSLLVSHANAAITGGQ
jgi:hypothetical protein